MSSTSLQLLFFESALVATIYILDRAATVGCQVVLYFRDMHPIAAVIFLNGAVDRETGDTLMSIFIFKHFKRSF